jgi:hypothetical protein
VTSHCSSSCLLVLAGPTYPPTCLAACIFVGLGLSHRLKQTTTSLLEKKVIDSRFYRRKDIFEALRRDQFYICQKS